MPSRAPFVVLLALVVGLGASACGSDTIHDAMHHDGSDMAHSGTMHGAEQMGTGRQADVMFTQQMIPHHQQAVDMADIALDPTHQASAEVRDLAARIKSAQTAEIVDMRAWLAEWGAASDGGHGDHMAMGMMSGADLSALDQAKGAAFDRLWLTGMIAHHEGALMMASHIAARGDDPRVHKLAASIDQSQTAEIREMKELLGQ